jgi:hypothetical protein
MIDALIFVVTRTFLVILIWMFIDFLIGLLWKTIDR